MPRTFVQLSKIRFPLEQTFAFRFKEFLGDDVVSTYSFRNSEFNPDLSKNTDLVQGLLYHRESVKASILAYFDARLTLLGS